MNLRRWLLVMLVLLAILCIQGCASLDEIEGWHPTHAAIPTIKYVVVSIPELNATCRRLNARTTQKNVLHFHACVERDYNRETCWIYVEEADPPKWIKEHEERHCKGESHI